MCVVSAAMAAGLGTAEGGMLAGMTAMEGVMMDLSLGGLALSTGNTFMSAKAAEAEADLNADIMERNAASSKAVSEYNAEVRRKQEKHDKLMETMDSRREKSRVRTLQAQGKGGSPLSLISGLEEQHQRNLFNIGYNADLDVSNILFSGQTTSQNYLAQSAGYSMQSSSISRSTPWATGATALSSGYRTLKLYNQARG